MEAQWITCDSAVETPMFRKTFTVGTVKKAEIRVCGLGYFSLRINGEKVTADLFTPAQSNYAPVDCTKFTYPIYDTLTARVYYLTYDITAFLKPGENTVDVIVGNGWYRQRERVAEGDFQFGSQLLANFKITLIDPENKASFICSDGSEQCFVYPILQSNLFLGEVWDTRLFEAPFKQVPVLHSDFKPENFCLQHCPADRVVQTIQPTLLAAENGRQVYDAGINVSGWVRLQACGKPGTTLTLSFAENMKGTQLDYASTGAGYKTKSGAQQIQSDTFILNGTEQDLAPLFVWHSFRYFEIAGEIAGRVQHLEPTVEVIHTHVPVTADFTCDREILNWLYRAYIRTQLNNYHGSIPTDCPHRERLGYTGDGQICAPAGMMLFDSRMLYQKWIEDILDCQDIYTGHIQHTAPFMGGGGGPGGWGCAVILVPWYYYLQFAEISMLHHAFPAMKKWLSYLLLHCTEGLLTSEEPDGWCLGDWANPGKTDIPADFVNTCFMVKCLDILAEISNLVGENRAADYLKIAENARQALKRSYFQNGEYASGLQGANAFAVWAKLPEWESLPRKLKERYEALGVFDTGFLGTDILCQVLFENGLGDLAVRLMAAESSTVGFHFMRQNGATTLFEYLDKAGPSNNHPMFGACTRQLFTGILGIRQAARSCGYMDVMIEPLLSGVVQQAAGSIQTIFGKLAVSFSLGQKTVEIEIPNGVHALFRQGSQQVSLKPGINRFVLEKDGPKKRT